MTRNLPQLAPGPVFNDIAKGIAARKAERERLLAEKTRPAREAAEAERRARAEQHRIAALEPLSNRLAVVVFDEIERQGRVLVKAQLAEAIHAALLRSGLARDPRWPPV
jgi:hypothetical protein